MKPAAYLVLLLVGASVAGNLVYLFRHRWRRPSRARRVACGLSVSLFALLLGWIVLDLFCYTFIVQSDNFSFTLAAQRWEQKYWKPRNDLRYRDREHPDLDGHKVLFVVGDSFVAGHGIKRADDRFPDVLERALGDPWEVVNIARNGWNTLEEFGAIVTYPHRPDRILLSYFLNDIEDAANLEGVKRPALISPPPRILRPIVDHSYLVNFLYWRVARARAAGRMIANYGDFRASMYENETIWARHEGELQRIVDYCAWQKIPLNVVIWPDLTDVKGTAPLTAKVAAFFAARDVPALDLAPIFIDRAPSTLILGSHDAHPNEATHKEVGEMLFEIIHASDLGQ